METLRINQNPATHKKLDNEAGGVDVSQCLTCGICNSRCSWYDGERGPVPRRIVRMVHLGLENILCRMTDIWDCHICNRCTLDCPMGIVMENVVRRIRSLAYAGGYAPQDLIKGVNTRLSVGDVNGLTKEEFIETIEWLSEEFSDDIGDPDAEIPYDKKNVKYLYLPNPRELGIDLLHLTDMARLFHAFGESWTMSSRHTDVTNWGYFIGDNRITLKMVSQIVEATKDMGAEVLVLSECGHGYYALKHYMDKVSAGNPGFSLISMPDLILEMAEKGVIKFDPLAHAYPIAYHDPCNLGRKSGIFDPPRILLGLCCQGVVELEPNRLHSICCGGGGGLIQDSTSHSRRMIAGKAKARQLEAAGVNHIATVCLSCHRQLTEISKYYNLDISVHTVASLAVSAMTAADEPRM
ncbi:MAG: (Fe-S)-binding protein [Deltaproteobacteria bacterium]|nr:(Fe-S)-binding protein [Deltaproteobacteria bacterium]